MNPDQRELLGELLKAIARIEHKSQPLLADFSLPDSEAGQDALDVICMQFMAVGEGLKRFERHWPGLLANQFPQVDWKGAMGFRDVIAHQYFDLDEEQVLLICEQSLPEMAAAVRRHAET
jgi:uncharacterized protein with HEPN domain